MAAAVVEEADADEQLCRIREINSGMFCFIPEYLFTALREIGNDNRQREFYLPDVLSILRRNNYPIDAQKVEDAKEVLGVNSTNS